MLHSISLQGVVYFKVFSETKVDSLESYFMVWRHKSLQLGVLAATYGLSKVFLLYVINVTKSFSFIVYNSNKKIKWPKLVSKLPPRQIQIYDIYLDPSDIWPWK